MSDEMQETPVPTKESRIKAVVKEIEDGLETVKDIPEHVVAWLKAKADEIKSHL